MKDLTPLSYERPDPVKFEWLDLHLFNSIEHAQLLATQWLWQYNNERPHTAIGGIPPRTMLNAA